MEGQEKTIKIAIAKESIRGDNVTIIALDGYLDSYNTQYFQNAVTELVTEENKYFVFDTAKLSYVSSAGIGALMAISRKIEDLEGDVILSSLNRKVLEVFNLLGFASFFKIADSLDKAKALLQESLQGEEDGLPGIPEDERIGKIMFPVVFTCQVCNKKLKAPKPGKYRAVPGGTTSIPISPGSAIALEPWAAPTLSTSAALSIPSG